MKILINMPYEQHCKWTLGAESIIDVALTNINHSEQYYIFYICLIFVKFINLNWLIFNQTYDLNESMILKIKIEKIGKVWN